MIFREPDYYNKFVALALVRALGHFARTGRKVTREWALPEMLRIATLITGKAYKCGQHQHAMADLLTWVAWDPSKKENLYK